MAAFNRLKEEPLVMDMEKTGTIDIEKLIEKFPDNLFIKTVKLEGVSIGTLKKKLLAFVRMTPLNKLILVNIF